MSLTLPYRLYFIFTDYTSYNYGCVINSWSDFCDKVYSPRLNDLLKLLYIFVLHMAPL